jgi:hypothetical protein
MRPDFLHNYIVLAPSVSQANETFERVFPTMLGVNISFRVPPEIRDRVSGLVKEHGELNSGRVKATIRRMTDKLKSEGGDLTGESLVTFWDGQLEEFK